MTETEVSIRSPHVALKHQEVRPLVLFSRPKNIILVIRYPLKSLASFEEHRQFRVHKREGMAISATSGVIDQCTVQDEADKSRPQS